MQLFSYNFNYSFYIKHGPFVRSMKGVKITFEIQYAAKQTIYAAFEREITQNFQLKKSLTYF